jgi:hypothetical protein
VNVNRYFLLALVSMAVWVVLIAVGIVQADAGRRRSRP